MITLDTVQYDLHSIQIKDAAGDALNINADGSVPITDNGGSITVDGTVELGATTLAALESITVQNGAGAAAVNIQDGGNSITVDGSVSVSSISGQFAEDSAHASGDIGNFMLAVRNDAGAAITSADGDYSPIAVTSSGAVRCAVNFSAADGGALPTNQAVIAGYDGAAVQVIKTDASGELQVDVLSLPADVDIRDLSHTQDSVKIGDGTDFLAVNTDGSINVQTVEAGYSSWKVTTATVGAVEAQLVSVPLTNRLRVEIQNLGSKDVWIRQITGVTSSNGLKISKGSSFEQALDAGASIFAISDGASADLRIAEYAA